MIPALQVPYNQQLEYCQYLYVRKTRVLEMVL
jgi:hypothetical protein